MVRGPRGNMASNVMRFSFLITFCAQLNVLFSRILSCLRRVKGIMYCGFFKRMSKKGERLELKEVLCIALFSNSSESVY